MTEDGEHLRRRLYRPGAGGADVDAYLAARDPDPVPGIGTARTDRRRWRPVVGVLVPAVVVVALVGVVRAPAGTSGARPTPLPTSTVEPRTSAAFLSRIRSDRDAGLAAWWDPGAPFVEEHGAGSRTVELPRPAGSARITVLLVLASDATAGWSIDRLVIHDDRTIHLSELQGADGSVRAGVPAVGHLDSTPTTQPSRLLVDAPDGVRWGVAAVYSD